MNTARAPIKLTQQRAMNSWGPRPRNIGHAAILDQTPMREDLPEHRVLERSLLNEIFNQLAIAVIIVSRKQRIVHSNAAALELLADGTILSSVRGVLIANDVRNHRRLRRAIQTCDLEAKLLPFETDSDHATAATVLPLSSGFRGAFEKCTAVFVHTCSFFDEGWANSLAAIFRLTGAEGRVLSALLEGLSLSDIARRHQISINTVRSQLQRLFAKTNTKRQSDLIRVASAAIPLVRNA
jgi:DNA-binding CsgD family transcriptional regulator